MPSRAPSTSPRSEQTISNMVDGQSKNENAEHELKDVQSQQRRLSIEDDLMALARIGELRGIQKLFDSGKYNANSADEQGITALHVGYKSRPMTWRNCAEVDVYSGLQSTVTTLSVTSSYNPAQM